MGLRATKLKELLARRRERQASKRMALRLAVFLGLVIATIFAYWQFQVHQALTAARADNMVEACGDLEETEALVEDGNPAAGEVDEQALAQRLDKCGDEGF